MVDSMMIKGGGQCLPSPRLLKRNRRAIKVRTACPPGEDLVSNAKHRGFGKKKEKNGRAQT